MNARAKRLPRLWCAMQGLLPLEACLAAQRGELAWPPEPESNDDVSSKSPTTVPSRERGSAAEVKRLLG